MTSASVRLPLAPSRLAELRRRSLLSLIGAAIVVVPVWLLLARRQALVAGAAAS